MAKPASIKIRLNSTAVTSFFYVTKKNARTKTEKLVLKKYGPVARTASTSSSAKARSSKKPAQVPSFARPHRRRRFDSGGRPSIRTMSSAASQD